MPRTTHNPWAAFDAADDPLRRALRLSQLNDTARSGAHVGGSIRPVIERSWQRSAAAGVDPGTSGPLIALDDDALGARREIHPLAPLRSTITRLLTDLSASAPYVLALSDADGLLLWVDGPDAAVNRAHEEMTFAAGADWSERSAGTNAVGTALAENHAVQIFSAEHVRPAVHGWTCSGAPIHDPETGEILGVLDATADLRTVDPATLPLLVSAARAAQLVLRAQMLRRDERLRRHLRERPAGAPRAALALSPVGRVVAMDGPAATLRTETTDRRWRIAVPQDGAGRIHLPDGRIGHAEPYGDAGFLVYADDVRPRATPAATLELLGTTSPRARSPQGAQVLSRGHAEILALLAVHADGLTADRLAVLLHGDDAHAGTARAACSRLRARLPGVVLTRPYRLADRVLTDLTDVRTRMDDGDLVGAVGAYRGPLLPESTAPGVRDIADNLHAELRGALIETLDAPALAAWCASPHAADDLPAAQALVRALPAGDPRRGAASGRIVALRRRLGLDR